MVSSIRVARLVSLLVSFIFVMVVFAILVGLGGVLLCFMISVMLSAVLRVSRVALGVAPIHAAVPGHRDVCSLGSSSALSSLAPACARGLGHLLGGAWAMVFCFDFVGRDLPNCGAAC